MKRAASLLLALLAIGGCHRKPEALPADAQGEAQARTSAKALADVAAAEEAARTTLPDTESQPAVKERRSGKRKAAPDEPAEERSPNDVSMNDSAPR